MQATITTSPFPDTSTGQAIGKPGLAILRNLTNTHNLPQVSTLNPEETIPETIHDKGKDFYVDGGYYRTLASNLKSVYWGIGLGGFIGTEYVRHPDKEYNFIIGPKLETELEVFILPRTALLARIQQHWNPLSIDKWNTVWNVGIKILLY